MTAVAAITQWRNRALGAVVLGLAALLALAMWGYDPLYAFTRGWALLFPFLRGCVVTHSRHAAIARRLRLVVAAATVGTGFWLWVGITTDAVTPTTGGDGRTIATVALGVLGCVGGTIATLAVAALVARTAVTGVVALVGVRVAQAAEPVATWYRRAALRSARVCQQPFAVKEKSARNTRWMPVPLAFQYSIVRDVSGPGKITCTRAPAVFSSKLLFV